MEWSPVYHVKDGENSTGTMGIFAPALTTLLVLLILTDFRRLDPHWNLAVGEN
jgi:hypothetical protein